MTCKTTALQRGDQINTLVGTAIGEVFVIDHTEEITRGVIHRLVGTLHLIGPTGVVLSTDRLAVRYAGDQAIHEITRLIPEPQPEE